MAVADKNANEWENMKGIDLRKDLSEEVSDPEMLEVLTECGYLTKSTSQVTQKMIETPKVDMEKEVKEKGSGKSPESICKAVNEVFTAITVNGNNSHRFL